jgi:hypothetical protein
MTIRHETFTAVRPSAAKSAVLDRARVGHIRGALGTILQGD